MSHPAKRARTDEGPHHGDVQQQPSQGPVAKVESLPDYEDMIGLLDVNTVRAMLLRLATDEHPPSAQTLIASTYQRNAHILNNRASEFHPHSVIAWYSLNMKYSSVAGTRESETYINDAHKDIKGSIGAIATRVSPECSYETKLNALKALCKIGESVVMAPGGIGKGVRGRVKSGGRKRDGCLISTILKIAGSMTPEEQARAGADTDSEASLVGKLKCLFVQMDKHLDIGATLVMLGVDSDEVIWVAQGHSFDSFHLHTDRYRPLSCPKSDKWFRDDRGTYELRREPIGWYKNYHVQPSDDPFLQMVEEAMATMSTTSITDFLWPEEGQEHR
ncbi:hypothetical protein F5Y18DRAFT_431742 [Xylariaceae sp. FL1019]|nr:hypothetical protein F5Y18DRAFT_431742 [Xylariaceae sp. FL1019]